MEIILVMFASCLIACVLNITGMAAIAHIVGAGVTQVSYFFGPILFKIPNTVIVIRAIPMGGSVSTSQYDNLSQTKRVLINISGILLTITVATICLGSISHSYSQFTSGFSQIIQGAVSPLNEAQDLLSRFLHLSYVKVLGIISCKIAAYEMFPIPPLSGGRIVTTIANVNKSSIEKLSQLGFCFVFIFSISWLVALIYFAIKLI